MDTWRYFDITHRDHLLCNPMSIARLDELIGLLDLPPEPRVLDIACGKGEFLLRLAEHADLGRRADARTFHATAIDISPYHLRELRESVARRVPGADIELLEMDAATYKPEPASFDLASCLGASWIYQGHRGTLRALASFIRPGGQVLVGEPFWRHEPDAEYLAFSGMAADDFGTHASNVAVGQEEGLVPELAFVSDSVDWDRYETLQWRAVARFAMANPDDPDLAELIERQARARHEYLAWGRETLGWAIYLFLRPPD